MSGNNNNSAGDLTDCPAAAPDFNFDGVRGVCRTCVVGNADVAGLGIVIGILLQAALMNFCVILWWIAGPGSRGLRRDLFCVCDAFWFLICSPKVLYENLQKDFGLFGATIRRVDSGGGFFHEELSERRREFRKKLQKLFKSWSDAQAVTGIALLFAAILQNNGGDLSLYHTAIVLNLIAVAADGQAIMLFYAFKSDTTISPPAQKPPNNPESSADKAAPTRRERLLNVDNGIWPRLVSSLMYLILDFIFSFKAFFRFRDPDECFFPSSQIVGNYGALCLVSAVLVLCVYIPIFIPQDSLTIFLEKLVRLAKTMLLFLYPAPPIAGEHRPRAHGIFTLLATWTKLILASIIWILGRFFEWILKREVSFPIGTLIYFLWNAVDTLLLKKANEVLLVGGGEEEKSFAAFGQIVPIVMVFAVVYPICDVMQEKKIGDSKKN